MDAATTTISAKGFNFTKLDGADPGNAPDSPVNIEIKDIAGFTAGTYAVLEVVDANTVKLGTKNLGSDQQQGGVGVLKTALDASATLGFIGIGLDGTASLGAKLSWGFNTAAGAPAADGRLTAKEVVDHIGDPLSLMLLPDLTPVLCGTTTAAGTPTTLVDSSQRFKTEKRVQVGDVIRRPSDGSVVASVVAIDSDTQLTTTARADGKSWASGDRYEIITRNFGVVDASIGLELGGDLATLANEVMSDHPQATLTVMALGDPFIDTRFEQANYTKNSDTAFTVDGDFRSKLPAGVTLSFESVTREAEVVVAEAEFVSGKTNVTVIPSEKNPGYTLPASLGGVNVVLDPKVDFDASNLGNILLKFSDFGFADVIAMLGALSKFLGQFESFGFLQKDLPIINKSVNDLLGIAQDFAKALEAFQKNPAGTLQLLEGKINESLGIASSTLGDIYSDLSLGIAPQDVIDLSYDSAKGILKLDLVWGTRFSQGLDVALPGLSFGDALSQFGLGSVLDLSGSANLLAEGSVLARLTLGVDVAKFKVSNLDKDFTISDIVKTLGDKLFVFDTTGLDANLRVGGDDVAFRVGVGPFALTIAGTDTEPASIALEGRAELGFVDTMFDSDGRVSFSTLFDNLSLNNINAGLTGTIKGVLPVFFPNDSKRLGTIRIGGTDADANFVSPGDLVNLVRNALGGGDLNFELISTDANPQRDGVQGEKANGIAVDVTEIVAGISSFDFSNFSILDNIILAVDGLDSVLELLQDVLGGASFSFPLIGNGFGKVVGFIDDLRDDFISPLRVAIEAAKDTARDCADPNKNIISKFLFEILGPNGANVLLPHEAGSEFDATQPGYYIGLETNLNEFSFDPNGYIQWDLNLGSKLVDTSLGLGFDLGIPGLGLKTEGDLKVNIDWAFDLAFGLNFVDGFFVRTDDPNELLFNVGVDVPATITGTLGFLGLTAKNKSLDFGGSFGQKETALGATFKVDIFEKGNDGSPLPNDPAKVDEDGDRLGFTEFGNIGLDAGVAAEASAALGLVLGLDDELLAGVFGSGASQVISGFPKIIGDFKFLWQLGNRATNKGTSAQQIASNGATEFVSFSTFGDEGFGAISEGLKIVAIENISLDVGSFLNEVLGPIVAEVSKFTAPIQPLIDFITSPVPIVGQLGLKITWLDLAQMLAGDKVNVSLFRSIAEIITLINDIAEISNAGSVLLPIGSFSIFDNVDGSKGGFRPELWKSGLDLDQTFADASNTVGVINDLIGQAGGIEGALSSLASGLSGSELKTVTTLSSAVSRSGGGGFSFPFLKEPTKVFGLLMGKDADLVAYDLGALKFGFDFKQFFPIFGPLGVSIGLLVEFLVDTAFVYDTRGIRDFVESGFRNPGLLFNGFAIAADPKLDGKDDPELTFLAELQAAAELNLGIASAGVAAAFGFLIKFNLFDPDGDGRIRMTELIGNIFNQARSPDEAARLLAPLAIFDVSGEIYARLFAFLRINLGFFKFKKDFPIFGPATLLSFNVDFFRPPILASELDNGDLLIHTGKFADQRLLGNATDLSEHIIIRKTGSSDNLMVAEISSGASRDNLGDDSTTPLVFKVKKGGTIIIDGGQGNDRFEITGFELGDVRFDIDLGVGDDELVLSGGLEGEQSIIRCGAGNDNMVGSLGNDLILGGAGDDIIDGGPGADVVLGDEGEIGTDSVTGLVRPGDGVDSIEGGIGSDILIGCGGKDTIKGGGSSDLLVGGGGIVSFESGKLKIFANLVALEDGGLKDLENLLLDRTAGDVLSGGAGADIVVGTAGPDTLTGDDDGDLIFGWGGTDTIDGSAGDDIILGDGGRLTQSVGGRGVATAGDATILVDSEARFLAGGVTVGDYLWNETETKFVRVTRVVNETTVETDGVSNWSGSSYSFFRVVAVEGTSDARDVIQGGPGDDLILAGGGDDLIVGGVIFETNDPGNLGSDDDQLYGGSGPDVLVGDNYNRKSYTLGGTGRDRLFGQGEPDYLLGGAGEDLLDGGAGPDVLKGGEDADTLLFNKGSDRLDGEDGGDSYFAGFQGGSAESLAFAQDSGASGVDLLVVNGTVLPDLFLLRANSDGSDAFIALIKDNFFVERINYDRQLERILINGSFGNDHFAIDDTAAEITINGEFGEDTFQVGQIFRSQRTPGEANISVTPFDETFATIETTRGFLSNGISEPMTINGGLGNDEFVVYHNKAVLQLNGEGGDDLFEIRAFALVGSQEPQRERTDISGGAGVDMVMYAVNAPVNIDGGDGMDTVVIIGTEFGDDFVVTEDGVYGAGLTVSFVNIEVLRVDAAEGNDRIFIQSTSEKFLTEVFGGLGEDTVFMSGDTPPIVSNDLRGHSGVVEHEVENSGYSGDVAYNGQNVFGISANVADNDEPFVVVRPTGGSTIITEGDSIWDEFTITLTRRPTSELQIVIAAPFPTPSDRERGALLFRVESPDIGLDPDDVSQNGSSIVLRFSKDDWYVPKTVRVIADKEFELADNSSKISPLFTRPEIGDNSDPDAARSFTMDDLAFEGVRFGVVNISVKAAVFEFPAVVLSASNGNKEGTIPTRMTVLPTKPVTVAVEDLLGQTVRIVEGPGFGQNRYITAVTSDGPNFVLTLDRCYDEKEVPDSSSRCQIKIDDAVVGTMDAFSEDTLQLIQEARIPAITDPNDKRSTFIDNDGDFPIAGQALTGAILQIVGGQGRGQQRLILGHASDDPLTAVNEATTTLILNGPWRTDPDTTSVYRIDRYDGLALPSVSVQVNDNDRPGLITDERNGFVDNGNRIDDAADVYSPDSDTITAVIENADGDYLGEKDVITVKLSADPKGTPVQVGLIYDVTQLEVRDLATGILINNTTHLLQFSGLEEKSLVVTALADGRREGFHTGLIAFEIHTGSADTAGSPGGEEFRTFADAPVFFFGLAQTPDPATVEVHFYGNPVALRRVDAPDEKGDFVGGDFYVIDNKVVFVDATGDPRAVEGRFSVSYKYNERGFLSAYTPPVLARINDFEAPTVIVRETDGSTDVVEVNQSDVSDPNYIPRSTDTSVSPWCDYYEIVLGRVPGYSDNPGNPGNPDSTVKVVVSPVITKTTRTGGIRHDSDQVEVFAAELDPRIRLETFTADDVGSSATILVDHDAQFVTEGVKIGDLVRSLSEGVFVKVTEIISETMLETEAITSWSGDQYTFGNLVVTFSASDWDHPARIGVRALDDKVVDGGDTQVFAPGPAVLSGILGPVRVEGASGAGSLSLRVPVLLPPNETNVRAADGNVVSFERAAGFGAKEYMTVELADLQKKVDADDPKGDALKIIDDLIGLTIEMARGQGLGVVLNAERPNEVFDRFWQITAINTHPTNSALRILTLRNPSQVDPGTLEGSAVPRPNDDPSTPDVNEASEYAITALSANFFVDETTQVDRIFVHDEDSLADSEGILTSTRLYGFNMGPDLVIAGALRFGGITYDDFEVIEVNLGRGNNDLLILGTHTREDGYRTWTLVKTGNETVPFTDIDNPAVLEEGDDVVVSLNASDGVFAGLVVDAANAALNVLRLATTITVDHAFEAGSLQGALIAIDSDGNGDPRADGQVRRIIHNVVDPMDPKRSLLTVDSPWEFLPIGEAYTITNEADGPVAVDLQEGDDTLSASECDVGLVLFGGLGMDTITGGKGDDIIFGDRGRVDYFNELGAIVTRLGYAPEPITGFVTRQVAQNPGPGEDPLDMLTDVGPKMSGGKPIGGLFPVPDTDGDLEVGTEDIGLKGLYVDINNGFGYLQTVKLIASNTATTLTLAEAFDIDEDLPGPVLGDPAEYRVSTMPEDQTDGVLRDPTLLITIDNGMGGIDTLNGGPGEDTIFGGAAGDTINAGDNDDVMIGDGGRLDRARDPDASDDLVVFQASTPVQTVRSYPDRLRTIEFEEGGVDTVFGDAGVDTILGSAYGDWIDGGAEDDFVLGDHGEVVYVVGAETDGVIDRLFTTDKGEEEDAVKAAGSKDGHGLGLGRGKFIRGDANLDGGVDIADAITGLKYLFGGGKQKCLDAIDVNDDGRVNVADPVYILGYLFGKKDPPPAPFPLAGKDPTEDALSDGSVGANDVIYGSGGDDVLIGGIGSDAIDGGTERDLIFGDNVTLDHWSHHGNFTNLRFEQLSGAEIYGRGVEENGYLSGQVLVDGVPQLDPQGHASWGDYVITLLDHSSTPAAGSYGNDYIAGGAHDDMIFGQLGNDTVQGDGSIDYVSRNGGRVGAFRTSAPPLDPVGVLTLNPSKDSPDTDGDDYIEGGGGNDVLFGNQGQDDIIGGSSDFFSLVARELRPDGTDYIFGGSGTHGDRNDSGDAVSDAETQEIETTANGHANDSDMILGDNGEIIRLVKLSGESAIEFLRFNYDTYGTDKIVVRAARLLDYTPGGPDYDASSANDIGAADEVHGESGDDFVYGMMGDDRLYGDGQDDDLIGGWGNDWISGGTGDDGVLGDDGRISTSRNSAVYGEPLYGISALLAEDLDKKSIDGYVVGEEIYTPGKVQVEKINVKDQLKKTVELTPFNLDPQGLAGGEQDIFFTPERADDIIYGGLGNDFLHGGAGDDAVSGAEALPVAYTQVYDGDGLLIGVARSGYDSPYNPGDALRFNPLDPDARHYDRTRRAGEFALYDEEDPLRTILLLEDGNLDKTSTTDLEGIRHFFLNFYATDGMWLPGGTLPKGDTTYDPVNTDGDDCIFGDLGNDWMVGGTGQDHLYSGWGNDLINADDDLRTSGGLNDDTDTHPSYEDRAFGGAGRDVLIANTGGDRLIDWVGEFNSYLTPFAPFGVATVSRTLQPQLAEFLYASSWSDGADRTRATDTGNDAARNGEPGGELGIVLQKDKPFWHDQTGAPADPQAGNLPGGKRDVLRSASFDDGEAQGFLPDSGTWTVANGRYEVAPVSLGGDAVSVFYVDEYLPTYFEISAKIRAVKPIAGYSANAYLIFDYQSPTNFKFAGVNVSTNKLEMGYRDAGGWHVEVQKPCPGSVKSDVDYSLFLALSGDTATLTVDRDGIGTTLACTFAPRSDADGFQHFLNEGMVGLGASNAKGQIDDVVVQRVSATQEDDTPVVPVDGGFGLM